MARCCHCLDYLTPDLVAIGAKSCGRCAVLLAELGDTVVEPPAREPGSDDDKRPARKPKPKDGKWLVWAANKKGRLRDAQAIGRQHGFPRRIDLWSEQMTAIAIEALKGPVRSTR